MQREIDLTWKGAAKPFTPSVMTIVKIENTIRKATDRPDFSIAEVMLKLDKDPVLFALVWGVMLHVSGHDVPDDVNDADKPEYWYQAAWEAIVSAGIDRNSIKDIEAARDAIVKMVAPSVDLGKPAAPRATAKGGGAKAKAAKAKA